jgi:hypothetical protein
MGNLPTMSVPGMQPGMPPALSPGDQAQIQMSQQMTQMMQVQMQWMQQMMQIQGAQSGQQGQPPMLPPMSHQPGMMPNLMSPTHPSQIQRPLSMPIPSSPRQDQRTMSTLSPNMAPWNRPPSFAPSVHGGVGGQGYAASIAPSERSNVGMASRYRPVSMAAESIQRPPNRSSTFTSGTFKSWANGEVGKQSPSMATIRPVNSGGKKASAPPDDEDDDQGWAEMKKKRDQKKSTWKMKKGHNGLQDLFHGGL